MSHSTDAPTPAAGAGDVSTDTHADRALSFVSRQRRYRATEDALGRRLYLLRTGVIVIPRARYDGGWYCTVADGTGDRLPVSDIEIVTALVAPGHVDPLAAITTPVYLTVWQAQAWEHLRHRRGPSVAECLARQARPDRTVTLAPRVVRWLLTQVDTTVLELQQILREFSDAGLLHTQQRHEGLHWGVYTFTLPGSPATPPLWPEDRDSAAGPQIIAACHRPPPGGWPGPPRDTTGRADTRGRTPAERFVHGSINAGRTAVTVVILGAAALTRQWRRLYPSHQSCRPKEPCRLRLMARICPIAKWQRRSPPHPTAERAAPSGETPAEPPRPRST